MTSVTQPLVWMDAVAQLREEKTGALPTVEALADQIQTFYTANALPLTAEEATEAAQRCLAQPDRAVPTVEVPWDRPTTLADWEARQKKAAQVEDRFDRHSDGFCLGFLGGLTAAGVGIAAFLGYDPGHLWKTSLYGVGGGLAGFLVSFILFGLCFLNPMLKRSKYLEKARKRLDPMVPTEDDLAALEQWVAIPQVATWLAQLRSGPVPILQGDLEEVRARTKGEAKRLAQTTLTERFVERLDGHLGRVHPLLEPRYDR